MGKEIISSFVYEECDLEFSGISELVSHMDIHVGDILTTNVSQGVPPKIEIQTSIVTSEESQIKPQVANTKMNVNSENVDELT